MAKSVNEAFDTFMQECVNLDPQINQKAKQTLNELLEELSRCSGDDFFVLYSDANLHYGSFSRKTKARPLDDIDVFIGISGEGATYSGESWNNITIAPSIESEYQQACKNIFGNIDSNSLLGKFKSKLKEICDLRVNGVIKNGEAICVQFKAKSNDLNFDIVPCFYTKPENDGRTYYLIPNKKGDWKKTDPRIDQNRVTAVVQKHGGIVLLSIRLVKWWNRYAKMTTFDGYVMESLLLSYYEQKDEVSSYVDINFINLLKHISDHIFESIPDPKEIEGDINNIPIFDRINIQRKINATLQKANVARDAERMHDHKTSINKWREIFGEDFPTYEE